ncbi:MAG: chromosomal replication initiator protein DnaA [Verrucomicrobiae bacterium]|nr:chromosomal replication initiator protein DnaA [Verrucomicrobiae bacterium]
MQVTAEKVWDSAQQSLRGMLNPDIYKLWFAPVRAVSVTPEEITLEVPNDFFEVWLKDNYLGLLRDAVAQTTGQALNIKFKTAAPGSTPVPPAPAEPAPGRAGGSRGRSRSAAEVDAINGHNREALFNPRNTFDTFVVGDNNVMAHGAAMAVAQNPGKAYNPLFLYGGVGLGKTHLLHAIGQYVVAHKKTARVAYVSCEKFTNEFIDAIQSGTLARFRKKYRQTDVLLIDDIQFLSGKERIQEEFFHTFNALHEAHMQIVLSCDRPPSEIAGLEDRLITRFEWGMVSDLQPPDVETRVAILRKKQELMGVKLPDEIINFLASRIRTNIRRLEGALTRVAAYASLTRKPLTLDAVENLLREVLHEEGQTHVTVEVILKRVAEHFDLRLSDLTGRRRPENIAFPRQIVMYLARELTESSLNTIGEALGGRDHGTVLHGCRLVKDRMEVDPHVRKLVEHLKQSLLR